MVGERETRCNAAVSSLKVHATASLRPGQAYPTKPTERRGWAIEGFGILPAKALCFLCRMTIPRSETEEKKAVA
jgi:hypothetical protein